MEILYDIPEELEPMSKMDAEYRVFEEFLIDYQPVLVEVEKYLEETIEKTEYIYREAYIPWKKALHQLLEGAYFMAKKIPLPNKDDFMEALFMFSFHGAIMFIRDICNICQLKLAREWENGFEEKIKLLLFSFSEMNNKIRVA